jgi:hypothetical protein
MPTTQTPRFATADQAKAYIIRHDRRVVQLDRMTVAELTQIDRQNRRTNGVLLTGPLSKDELVNSIIETEYSLASQARAAYLHFTIC